MAEFRYDQNRKAIVRVVEEVAAEDAEAQLQAELDEKQNVVNTANELLTSINNEWEELNAQATAKGEEVDAAKVMVLQAEEDLKSAVSGRDSLAAARTMEQELANADPATEFEEDTAGTDIPVTVVPTAEA